MSDLERRSSGRMSRSQREKRAYNLVLATGGFGTLFVAALVLSILGIVSGSWAVLFAVIAVISGLLLRRTLRP